MSECVKDCVEKQSELKILENRVSSLETVLTELNQKTVSLESCLINRPITASESCDKKEPNNRLDKLTDKINELIETTEMNIKTINNIEDMIR